MMADWFTYYQQLESQPLLDQQNNPNLVDVKVGGLKVGTIIYLQGQWDHDRIQNIRYQVYGSRYALACLSYTVQWLTGKTREQILAFNHLELVRVLHLPLMYVYEAVLMEEAVKKLCQ